MNTSIRLGVRPLPFVSLLCVQSDAAAVRATRVDPMAALRIE